MAAKFMETGEMGFCPVCGTTSAVVVLPDDRLQKRIAKLVEQKILEEINGSPEDVVKDCIQWIRNTVDRRDDFTYKEILVTIQIILAFAGEAFGELLNEPVDLMRLALETLEAGHD